MATFNFGKRKPDDEGIPPEPLDGESEVRLLSDVGEGGSRFRRPLVFAGIGVVLIGGLYLANLLFFSEPPAPPVPVRRPIPPPATPGPATPTPAHEPSKTEVKSATKAVVPLAPAKTPEPAKTVSPAAPSAPPPPAPTKKAVAPAQKAQAPGPAAPVKPSPPAVKSEAKAPPKAPSATAKGYTVQVGAMAQQANAEALKKKLETLGYPTTVRKGSGFASKHTVTVGDPVEKNDAEATIRRLGVDGFPSTLIPMEGKYSPLVGSFVNLDDAIDMARELQKKNYRPKITSKPATTAIFQVRHGQFATRDEALKRGEELKSKGFSAWVVRN